MQMPSSNEDRLRRLDSLFDQAQDLPESERRAFLAALDTPTRESLERLLAFDGLSPLGEAIAGLAQTQPAPADLWPGERIGAYRVTREIGHG